MFIEENTSLHLFFFLRSSMNGVTEQKKKEEWNNSFFELLEFVWGLFSYNRVVSFGKCYDQV